MTLVRDVSKRYGMAGMEGTARWNEEALRLSTPLHWMSPVVDRETDDEIDEEIDRFEDASPGGLHGPVGSVWRAMQGNFGCRASSVLGWSELPASLQR